MHDSCYTGIMNIIARRLIGLAVSLAAIAYIGITHSKAVETFIKDTLKSEDDPEENKDAEKEKQDG